MTGEDAIARAGEAAEEPAPGALLRTWRERALLTQEELAVRAGLNVRTIRRLEAGELRRPRSTSIRLLAEALGLDETERAILTRAPGQDAARQARPVPRQLPADTAAFVGRTRELALLDRDDLHRDDLHRDDRDRDDRDRDDRDRDDRDRDDRDRAGDRDGDAATVVITAIDGMAGVGKTALAVHAAHRLAPRFPHGDLFVDLHGYTQGMIPADPADTLARLLAVLGVPGEAIPQHLDDRAALYRSLLADRKMLIVLDNAADEAQVRPLLPGAGDCLVLVTSRRRLVGLDDARTVSVDVLPPADAIALLTATAGAERVADAPPGALAEVVRRCGLLPLAIRLAAARLKAHPAWTVQHLLDRLEEHRLLLSELHAGQRSMTAALELSYRELDAAEQRAYRLLGLHPGVDLGDAAAALLDTPRATALLDRLLEAHLLQEPVAGRYRLHDLIRAHAAQTAAAEEPADSRRAALSRLLDHYSRAASAAMDRLYPYEADMRPRLPPGEAAAPAMADAAAWLEAELPNLLALAQHAADHGFPAHIRHLSATLDRWLHGRGRHAEAEALHTRALSAAREAADRDSEMEALMALGDVHRIQGRYKSALEDLSTALDLARATGRRSGELRALNGLGFTHLGRDEFESAAHYGRQALAIARSIGHRTGELDALIFSGNVHRLMGRYLEAADYLAQALDIARSIGHRAGELRALNGLGFIDLRRGELGSAGDHLRLALRLGRDTGHRIGQLGSLTGLGYLHRMRGRHEEAANCYRQVIDLAREIGNRNWQFEAVHGMGRLQHDLGRYGQALDNHREALGLATDLDQPSDQVRAHDGIAHAYAALGRHDRARHHWTEALTVLTSLGIDRMDEEGVDAGTFRAHLSRLAADASRSPTTGGRGAPGQGDAML